MAIVEREAGKVERAIAKMGVAAAAGAATTATVIHNHTGEMTTMVTMMIEEIEVAHPGPHGTEEDAAHGTMASPPQNHATVIVS